eukprot:TRINITY_DN640_c8_g1_i1.p1 TRINITY_DN640_c8_g1~~TRINITY_DN640_c8_g1_i1.p1  ORF type:complete len:398 (+),score=78.51 TRINITY_DN640_c8_g1_i1:134-1327(+)
MVSAYTTFLVIGMLATGALNTISKKFQNQVIVRGLDGTAHPFDHAWFQTWVMFVGETLCLIGLLYVRWRDQRARTNTERWKQSYESGELDPIARPTPVCAPVFLIPTIFDLAGTTFGGIGLLFVSGSVWQMVRGTIIVFTGILSVLFLKRKLYLHHWLGMGVVVSGLLVVASSQIIPAGAGKSSNAVMGIGFILLGQVMNAIQMVFEEMLIKKKGKYHPLAVVGMEGLSGVVLMTALILPTLYFLPATGEVGSNFHDNSLDAIVQIANSQFLLVMTILYLFSIAFYNFFGLSVTKALTVVHRTLIDALRTIVVWLVNLIVYYVAGESYGEAWVTPWSFLQLGGFALLILGTLLYNEVIKVPCSTYKKEDTLLEDGDVSDFLTSDLASPTDEKGLLDD